MSGESSAPRTLVYARHIGRELALLTLSSLTQFGDDSSLDQASRNEAGTSRHTVKLRAALPHAAA